MPHTAQAMVSAVSSMATNLLRMRAYCLTLIIAFSLTACSRLSNAEKYSEEISEELINKALDGTRLDSADYNRILLQLDGMFNVVYEKAQNAIDNGVDKDSIRSYLSTDPEYVTIGNYATVLDSILLQYVHTPYAPHELRADYNRVLSRASKRAAKVGLN